MYKILIVEDNKIITDFMTNILSKHYPEWTIHNASSYGDALMLATENNYNLFILDYELNKEMDTENGFNLGITLKKMNKYKNVPVIFETSYPDHIFTAVNELNCIYYLVKPYTESDVNSMINKILQYNNVIKRFSFQDNFGINTYVNDYDIIYVKSDRHSLEITSTVGSLICANYSLTQLINESSVLIQCHKSFAVNPTFIQNIDKTTNTITFNADSNLEYSIPIGRKYKEIFLRKLG